MSKKQFQADSLARAARPVIEALESRTLLSASALPATADSALAYDAAGKLHMAYYDGADKSLKYATRLANGRWADGGVIDDSSPNVGAMPSLALDSVGNPAVAYYDAWGGDLKYSHWNGSVWDTQAVDTHGATGLYPSLAFDSADAPIIASYSATRGDLRLSKLYHGGWRSFTLDAEGDVGRHPALAVDPTSGLWTVAYEATGAGELRFVNAYNGGRVLGGVIDAKALGGSISLAFDGATSRARVGYADALSGEVRVATGTAAGWTSDVVGKGSAAVAVRPGGGAAGLVYRDKSGTLVLAERPAVQKAKWSSVEIGAGAAGSAAAFSAAGDVAVTQPGANPAAASAPAVGERFAAAPSRVTVTHVDGSTLRVDWLDNTVGESGFRIDSSADGGRTWQQAAVAGRNATATNVGGLTEGKTYAFRASAMGGSAEAATASANAAAAPASSGTDPLDTPGWFRVNGIALASEAERTYNLTDHVGVDTSRAYYASSWADAAYQAAAAYKNADGTSAYEHVDNTDRDYFTTDSGAFRFGYSAAIKRETEGEATQLPDDETLKIIAFEDSHAAIDRDFDDRYWTVSVEKYPVTIEAVDDHAVETAGDVDVDTASFVVTRYGDLSASLDVPYTVGGTATEGSGAKGSGDYLRLDGYSGSDGTYVHRVSIPAGSATATITVVPVKDADTTEFEETVEVTLMSGSSSGTGSAPAYETAGSTTGPTTSPTTSPTTNPTTAKVTIAAGTIGLDADQDGKIGGVVPSIAPKANVVHFVSPKSAGDKVTLVAGVPAGKVFGDLYRWGGDGEADAGAPEKRIVKRDVAGRFNVELLDAKTGKPVFAYTVWVVWAKSDTQPNDHVVGAIEESFLVENKVDLTRIRTSEYILFSISPKSILTDADRPDFSGNPAAPPNAPIANGLYNSGKSLAGGVNSKWDTSRQLRQKVVKPAGLNLDNYKFSNGDNAFDDYQAWPVNSLVGNDDNLTNDEDNNPYDAAPPPVPVNYLGEFDYPNVKLAQQDGAVNDVVQVKVQFRDFARLEIAGKWFRISDDADWRLTVQMKKVDETVVGNKNGDGDATDILWINDGSSAAKDHAGW